MFVYKQNGVALREKQVFVYKLEKFVYKHKISCRDVEKRNRDAFVEAQKCVYTRTCVFVYKHLALTDDVIPVELWLKIPPENINRLIFTDIIKLVRYQ